MAESRRTRNEQGQHEQGQHEQDQHEQDQHEQGRHEQSAGDAAKRAMAELRSLTGKPAEGVIGLERTEDGWTVTVEALELRRVPNTTDVLATYAVDLDRSGDMVGYRRVRRYVRGAPDEE